MVKLKKEEVDQKVSDTCRGTGRYKSKRIKKGTS